MDDMARRAIHAYHNALFGLILPVALASCFMDTPVDGEAVSNGPPPIGTNYQPQIWGTAPPVVKVGVLYSFTPQAMDVDRDPLAFSIDNMPTWATFDTASGQLSGVPLSGQVGTYNDIKISVSDGQMSTALPMFSVSVEPDSSPNMPPEIDGIPAPSVTVGHTYSFTPSGFDPDGDALTYSILNRPGWATFSSSTGQLSGIPQTEDIGVHGGIAIAVSDGVSTSSLPAFSISVVAANSAPQISGTPSSSIDVGQAYSFTPSAFDPEGDSLVFSIQNQPSWAQFNAANGSLSGTPQAGDAGTYTNISISVSDGDLSDTLQEFNITVNQVSLGIATLNWIPPTANTDGSALTDLAGYKIYYGTSQGDYPNQITINNPGTTTYVVENLAPNTWYFVTTSFNSSGMESDYSNEVSRTIN
jgi:hypothetical protein